MTKEVCGFEIGFLKQIKDLLIATKIEELEIEEGQNRYIRVSRKKSRDSNAQQPYLQSAQAAIPLMNPPSNQPVQIITPAKQVNPYDDEKKFFRIKSPVIGTFYGTPSPESPPYVKVGDVVSEDTTVCIVEAMKVMNEIKADIKGRIVEILKSNGNPVQTKDPLFIVEII